MKLVRIVAAAAMAVALTPAVAASAAAPAGTESIIFDGYCDGMSLNIPSAGLGTAGTLDGVQTGCVVSPLFGQAKGGSVNTGTEYVTVPAQNDMYVIRADHTWVLYQTDGTKIVVQNSGTWSNGTPNADRGVASGSIHQAAGGGAGILGRRIRNVTFDGYCDGMHFNIPSVGLGTPTTIDGNRTGSCVSADPLFGETSRIAGVRGNVVSFFADGFVWLQAGVFRNHTWVFYATDGTNEYILNSGTWTRGTPPQPNGLKPSV